MAVTESMVSSMRSQLSNIRSENAQLEREISAMCNSIRSTYDYVVQAKNDAVGALNSGESTLNNDDKTLHGVDAVRQDIQEKIVLYKNMENAYKNIRQLNNKLRYQQGSEKTVKSVLIAILDNEDKNLVSEETLERQAEKAYTDVTAQKFFLTFLMRDIQLRKSGKKQAADRARLSAVEMDSRNSAWVYFLIALKRKDEAEQALWLDKIIARPLSGSEKENLKILTMLALRDNSPVAKKIGKYIGIDAIAQLDKDDTVARILACYKSSMTIKPPKFKYVSEYVTESGDLHESLRGAMNNETVGAYIQQVSTSKEDKMRDSIISKMLDTIIGSCNSPEAKEILKEIDRNQHVIDARGVLADASALDLKQDIEDVSDIKLEDCLYDWLTENKQYNGKKELSDFAYGKLKPSYKRAYRQYLGEYRKKNRQTLTVGIGDYQTQSPLTNPAEEAVKIEKFCNKRCESEKAAIKNTKFILFTVFGAILLLAGIILKFIPQLGKAGSIAACVIGSIAGTVLLIFAVVTRYKNYRAKVAADERCRADIAKYTEIMQLIISDMDAFRDMYRAYDKKALTESFF